MKHIGSMNLWGNEPLRTFGICGAEVVLRVGIICVNLEHQIYQKPEDVSVASGNCLAGCRGRAGCMLFGSLCETRLVHAEQHAFPKH